MSRRIVVINPNSSQWVTDAISEAVDSFRGPGLTIDCLTLQEGPSGIISQRDVDLTVAPLLKRVTAEADRADAFVIACYSDPGVFSLREITAKPVLGAAQSTLGYAAATGGSIGVISLKQTSVARHMAHAGALGLRGVIANDRAADVTVDGLGDDAVSERLCATAEDLVRLDGAEVIVLGCCGMSRFRPAIEARVGLPVLDPSQVAVGLAVTAVCADYTTPARGGVRR